MITSIARWLACLLLASILLVGCQPIAAPQPTLTVPLPAFDKDLAAKITRLESAR